MHLSFLTCLLLVQYISLSAGCDTTQTGSTGTVTSPGFPANYKNNVKCVTYIQPPGPGQIFIRFNLVAMFDSDVLTITSDYGGFQVDLPISGFPRLFADYVTMISQKMTLSFTSNNDGRVANGFNITWNWLSCKSVQWTMVNGEQMYGQVINYGTSVKPTTVDQCCQLCVVASQCIAASFSNTTTTMCTLFATLTNGTKNTAYTSYKLKTRCLTSSTGCGDPDVQSMVTDHIIGGKPVNPPHSYPWQAEVHDVFNRTSGFLCGGSIVDNQWIVTAAHCMFDKNTGKPNAAENYEIMLGVQNTDVFQGSEVLFKLERYVVHPQYDPIENINDIAMLKLAQPIVYDEYMKPICLPQTDPPAGTLCRAMGWGKTSDSDTNPSTILNWVDLPIIAQSVCRQPLYWGSGITDGQLCAGYPQGGKSTCKGDSGGPLVCQSGGFWYLHGITSFGSAAGCAVARKPSVFTRVTSYLSFIAQTINEVKVNGGWSSWVNSSCSVTCGKGSLTMTRTCTNPAPAGGGTQCIGSRTASAACSMPACPTPCIWVAGNQGQGNKNVTPYTATTYATLAQCMAACNQARTVPGCVAVQYNNFQPMLPYPCSLIKTLGPATTGKNLRVYKCTGTGGG